MRHGLPLRAVLSALARTQVKLGKLVLAQESSNKILREQSQNPNPPPAFKDALESAKTEVGPVSAKLASVSWTPYVGAGGGGVTGRY